MAFLDKGVLLLVLHAGSSCIATQLVRIVEQGV
jgi:hypothetical protein